MKKVQKKDVSIFKKKKTRKKYSNKEIVIREKINLYMYIEEKIQSDRKNEVKDNGSNGNNKIEDNRRIEGKTQRTF